MIMSNSQSREMWKGTLPVLRHGAQPLVEEGTALLGLGEVKRKQPASSLEKLAMRTERIDVVVIGGGQAGLSVGYSLARRGVPFVILDGSARVGDSWRNRWDSLRLFTTARYDGLVGMPFPAPAHAFPTKDEMADYLEAYAKRFALPIRSGVRVDRLFREGSRYVVEAGALRFEAKQVVVAMSSYQVGRVPPFARELDASVVQLHSIDYRSPAQLREGGVLVVGAGNSGAEIALEVSKGHPTWLSGRDTGHVPFRVESRAAQSFLIPVLFRFLFHRVLTVRTRIGQKVRPKILKTGAPLIRVKPGDLVAAGVERVPKVAGVRDGMPLLENGRVLEVANVIWCTGFHPGFSWIDLPVLDPDGEPRHESGIVASEPGLYFVGLHFLHAFSSTMIHGIERDAQRVADAVLARRQAAGRVEVAG
jgi:putative flavoprotein involved in K+ transport